MRRFLVLAAAVPLLSAPAARADAQHEITAECAATGHGFVTGETLVSAAAVAGGHFRSVSTYVRCTAIDGYGVETTFEQSVPGPVAATAGPVENAAAFLRVCVTASAYWSDGHTLGPTTACDYIAATLSIAS